MRINALCCNTIVLIIYSFYYIICQKQILLKCLTFVQEYVVFFKLSNINGINKRFHHSTATNCANNVIHYIILIRSLLHGHFVTRQKVQHISVHLKKMVNTQCKRITRYPFTRKLLYINRIEHTCYQYLSPDFHEHI